ncbi:MAG TPA: tRNA (adenosine(37)-N6)-dimethylallyltransferase MiaA [Terriglobales bacterium]|nr:tRNA (adenosine(37)-N6)-dimethylallyltransferase MiaA [Terriglobales bacterium]
MPTNSIPALVVAGPTASGKTALGVCLAQQLAGEIVSFDSVQLYRDFDIGAAKPSAAELAAVPHHLIGAADARHPWTAGEYARRARPVVKDIARRGKLPVLVGGTGFYLRALLQGLSPAPAASESLRQKLRRRNPEQIHRLLQRLDPEAAARIQPRDAERAIRALEVRLLTGKPMGEAWRAAAPQPWLELRPLKLGLAPERAALYQRIEARAALMFAGGIQAETRRLLAIYPPELRIWTSHGYKQACDIVLRGANPAAALAEAAQEQRHYAKRQWTWFRADPDVHWLPGFGDDPAIQQAALSAARHWLFPDH